MRTRIAVGLAGEIRGCTQCLDDLRTKVIEPLESTGAVVDLFVVTRKDDWCTAAYSLPYRSLTITRNRPMDLSPIVSDANPKERGDDPSLGGRRAFLYQSYVHQYWSLYELGQVIRMAEVQDGVLYDWIVRSRPDVSLKYPIDLAALKADRISVPWNDWWPYEHPPGNRWETICDKFAVGPSPLMAKYLNRIDALARFCRKYRIHGEAFTAWHLTQQCATFERVESLTIVRDETAHERCWRPDRDSKE